MNECGKALISGNTNESDIFVGTNTFGVHEAPLEEQTLFDLNPSLV